MIENSLRIVQKRLIRGSIICLEKLIVAKLVNKFLAFYHVHKSPTLVPPIQSQVDPVYTGI